MTDITDRPEPPETLRARARSSAEEFQHIAVAISSGALGVFFIALTEKIDPPLTSAEHVLLLCAIAAMGVATLCAVLTWFADARWNAALAAAKEATDPKDKESNNRATRAWHRADSIAGIVFGLTFVPGLVVSSVYLWLRAN